MLKAVLILVVVIVAMAFAGWLTIQRTPSETTVTIDTARMEKDASRLAERGEELVRDASRDAEPRPDSRPVLEE